VTEAGKSEQIILRVPRNVWYEVQESALVLSSSLRSICISRGDIPDMRGTIFWPCEKELAIRIHNTSNHEILALSAKEPLSDSWVLHRFIFKPLRLILILIPCLP
jgi:hypothetical protein